MQYGEVCLMLNGQSNTHLSSGGHNTAGAKVKSDLDLYLAVEI